MQFYTSEERCSVSDKLDYHEKTIALFKHFLPEKISNCNERIVSVKGCTVVYYAHNRMLSSRMATTETLQC